jgi:hypothetical protein
MQYYEIECEMTLKNSPRCMEKLVLGESSGNQECRGSVEKNFTVLKVKSFPQLMMIFPQLT